MASVTLNLSETVVERFRHNLIGIPETEMQIIFPSKSDDSDTLTVALTDTDENEIDFCGRVGRMLLMLSKEVHRERQDSLSHPRQRPTISTSQPSSSSKSNPTSPISPTKSCLKKVPPSPTLSDESRARLDAQEIFTAIQESLTLLNTSTTTTNLIQISDHRESESEELPQNQLFFHQTLSLHSLAGFKKKRDFLVTHQASRSLAEYTFRHGDLFGKFPEMEEAVLSTFFQATLEFTGHMKTVIAYLHDFTDCLSAISSLKLHLWFEEHVERDEGFGVDVDVPATRFEDWKMLINLFVWRLEGLERLEVVVHGFFGNDNDGADAQQGVLEAAPWREGVMAVLERLDVGRDGRPRDARNPYGAYLRQLMRLPKRVSTKVILLGAEERGALDFERALNMFVEINSRTVGDVAAAQDCDCLDVGLVDDCCLVCNEDGSVVHATASG